MIRLGEKIIVRILKTITAVLRNAGRGLRKHSQKRKRVDWEKFVRKMHERGQKNRED